MSTYVVEVADLLNPLRQMAEFTRPESAFRIARDYADRRGYAQVVQVQGDARQIVCRVLNTTALAS